PTTGRRASQALQRWPEGKPSLPEPRLSRTPASPRAAVSVLVRPKLLHAGRTVDGAALSREQRLQDRRPGLLDVLRELLPVRLEMPLQRNEPADLLALGRHGLDDLLEDIEGAFKVDHCVVDQVHGGESCAVGQSR